MKKYIIMALALMGLSTSAMAIDNEPEEGFTTQVFMGLSASNVKGYFDYGIKPGGTAGIKLEYMLPNAHGTYINGGLDWVMKGCKNTLSLSDIHGADDILQDAKLTTRLCPHYLEIPIHVGFHYNFSEEIGVYGELGPYFAIGVGGKLKTSVDADGLWTQAFEYDYPIFKKDNSRDYFQRWDAGLGFRVGAEYNQHYSLNLGCDWGLTDMWRNEYRDIQFEGHKSISTIKNFNLTLCFGYRF